METGTTPVPVSVQQLKDAWPQIVATVQKAKRSAWMVAVTATPRALTDDNVLTLSFPSQNDVDSFRERAASGDGVSDHLRAAIYEVLGIRVRFIARPDGPPSARQPSASSASPTPPAEPTAAGGWATVSIPHAAHAAAPSAPEPVEGTARPSAPSAPESVEGTGRPPLPERASLAPSDLEPPEPDEPEPDWTRVGDASEAPTASTAPGSRPAASSADEPQRYGESVVREILGASFIEEKPVARVSRPTIRPTIEGG